MSGLLLRGVIAYVDIRSPFGGGGSVMTQRLLSLGAAVEMTRNNSVTHVIFRNGDPATKLWAEKRDIYIVTPAWVKACVNEKTRVPEACYYIKEKEDLELENDFNLIATRNGTLVTKAPATSFLLNDCLPSNSFVNESIFVHSNTPSGAKSFFGNDIYLLSSSKPIPLGWKCLPSPQQRIDTLPLPETSSSIQEAQPHISDLAGLPLSPDVLNYVVRNLATSSPNRSKFLKNSPKRILTPPQLSSAAPFAKTEVMRNSLSSEKVKKMEPKPQSPLFRKALLERVLKSKADVLITTESAKSPEPEKPRRSRKLEKVAPKASRRSTRLSAKLRANFVTIDSEVTVNLSTLNVSSPETHSSLEDFVQVSSLRSRRQYRSTTSTRGRPIEILFSGLTSFQRQTLVTILRSCPYLSKREINPTINERLCGVHNESVDIGSHTPRSSSRFRSAKAVSAALGPSEVVAAAREQAQRWRLTDRFRQYSTTHLVTSRESTASSPCPRTVNFFKAVISSVPIVDQAWIKESAEAGRWLPHQRFLIPGVPSVKSRSKLRTLFSKIGSIFVAPGTSPSPKVLRDLIVAGGGTISRRPFGATLVIGQLDARRPSVTPKWVLESILHRSPLPYHKFRVLE